VIEVKRRFVGPAERAQVEADFTHPALTKAQLREVRDRIV
jgi:hypothetical protein